MEGWPKKSGAWSIHHTNVQNTRQNKGHGTTSSTWTLTTKRKCIIINMYIHSKNTLHEGNNKGILTMKEILFSMNQMILSVATKPVFPITSNNAILSS